MGATIAIYGKMKAKTGSIFDPPPGLKEDPMTTPKLTSSRSAPALMQIVYFALVLITGLTSNRRHIRRLTRRHGVFGASSNLLSHRALEGNLAVILEKQYVSPRVLDDSPAAMGCMMAHYSVSGNGDPGGEGG